MKFSPGDLVAVCTVGFGGSTIIPGTSVVRVFTPQQARIVASMKGQKANPLYYYQVAADCNSIYAEPCLRRIDDDEYRESNRTLDQVEGPVRSDGVKAIDRRGWFEY